MDLDADDLLEDVDTTFDNNELKSVMELAMRMAEIVRSTPEWHRRMTSNKLSQTRKSINYEALIPGAKVYFYKPPSAQDVLERGRKAKHLDHYTGPATILRAIGNRSFVLQYTDAKGATRTYQRDASMISLVSPKDIKVDPSVPDSKPPHLHRSLKLSPIEEGEYIIIKDTKDAKSWYCAQVLEKLPDRIKISYYTTTPRLWQITPKCPIRKGSQEFKRPSSLKHGPCPLERQPPRTLSSRGRRATCGLDWSLSNS